ncbi:hypothetical protein J4558_11600 [Leptolyngbya sp. 15MV]|nr:hypothetical protein J4558_11600 [Leptolyngbya sp. 15MV]
MMKGKLRSAFTTAATTRFSTGLGVSPAGRVRNSSSPTGMPISTAKTMVMPTISRVSRIAF